MFLNKIVPNTLLTIIILTAMGCKTDQDKSSSTEIATTSEKPSITKPLRPAQAPSEEFKSFWYAGKAEITSYILKQSRYGELREGTAVLIYVTEDFLPDVQVKADNYSAENIGVLKLNATKNFHTGIYPYHIMQSTFFPVSNNQHALKVTASVQEWCGHVYTQINNREQFEVKAYSYFQSEGDQDLSLNKNYLENELWVQMRINHKSLPVGEVEIIPSLEYLRLKHKNIKAYKATAKLINSTYTLNYPDLNRTLIIQFNPEFPYNIKQWEETYPDGREGELVTTTAVQIKTIMDPYWQQNGNKDNYLRGQLGLK